MSNLKALRTRIKSVNSTKKITAAMKMIAAAKLKKAQVKILNARPYAAHLSHMLHNISQHYIAENNTVPNLLTGNGQQNTVMIIVATSNRGLCGGFNTSIVRQVKLLINKLQGENKQIKLFCIGNKGYDQLQRQYKDIIIDSHKNISELSYVNIKEISEVITELYYQGTFDQCIIVYNKFLSALQQEVTTQQLIPVKDDSHNDQVNPHKNKNYEVYEFEPDDRKILAVLVPLNLATQLYTALLDNDASEQGTRMAAMESATRNAEDMIRKLSLTYNRTRQSYITNELIEIISGAEAL